MIVGFKQFLVVLIVGLLFACNGEVSIETNPSKIATDYTPKPYIQVQHPDWLKDAVIYQINTRQYSDSGKFTAVQDDLPRLKELGVDILWFMPIQPIGEKNRKGSLGSPYSIQDYTAINPDYGSIDDFKALVDVAHEMGFQVILDWVANHSAWDNSWVADHPDWYTKDADGNMQTPPWTDWNDVANLDYSEAGLRKAMTEAMVFWVEEIGIDGFRCDVAGFVPLDFWETTRERLEQIKPIFMLAEWQTRDLHRNAFDASYGWAWKEAMQKIANGEANAGAVSGYYGDMQNIWPENTIRLLYTSNHDQNSWDGLPQDIYGEAYSAMMALSFVSEGIPMIYNGQEAGSANRLEFFDKDAIVWKDDPKFAEFKHLIELKKTNSALWNGKWGGRTQIIENTKSDHVFSFMRVNGGNNVLAIFNLSDGIQTVALQGESPKGTYADFDGRHRVKIDGGEMVLQPWQYRILSAND